MFICLYTNTLKQSYFYIDVRLYIYIIAQTYICTDIHLHNVFHSTYTLFADHLHPVCISFAAYFCVIHLYTYTLV